MKRLPSTPQHIFQQELEEIKRKFIKRQIISLCIFASLVLIVTAAFWFFDSDFWHDIEKTKYENELRANGIECELIFSDEENGNAILLECDGSFALIDSGSGSHREEILSFLKENKVEELEYYFVLDATEEYKSVFENVLNSVEIQSIILPADRIENGLTADFDEIAFMNGRTSTVLSLGSSFFVHRMILEVIDPYSSSFEIRFGNHSFIIWNSDDESAEAEAVKYFDEEKTYVLWLGKQANQGKKILETLTPQYCIVDSENENYDVSFMEQYAEERYVTNDGEKIIALSNEVDLNVKTEN